MWIEVMKSYKSVRFSKISKYFSLASHHREGRHKNYAVILLSVNRIITNKLFFN